MINIFLGLGIGGYGLYSIFNPTGDMNINFWLKFGGMTIIGLGIALYNLFPLLYSQLTNFKLPTLPIKKKEEEMAKTLGANIEMKSEEEQDDAAIFYLVERLKENPEAVDLLRKVNDHIFSLHHPIKKG